MCLRVLENHSGGGILSENLRPQHFRKWTRSSEDASEIQCLLFFLKSVLLPGRPQHGAVVRGQATSVFEKKKKVKRVKTVRKENNTWNCQRQGGNLSEWGVGSRDRQEPSKQSRPCGGSTPLSQECAVKSFPDSEPSDCLFKLPHPTADSVATTEIEITAFNPSFYPSYL